MNYWRFPTGDLESIVFQRSTTGVGFDGIPTGFQQVVNHSTSAGGQQNQPNNTSTAQQQSNNNSNNEHCVMQQHTRQQQQQSQQHQQTANANMSNSQTTNYHHQQQPQQQQSQQQHHQQHVKQESRDRQQQQAMAGGVLNLQLAHMPQLAADGFLPVFQTGNAQVNNVASVAGMILSALPPPANMANNPNVSAAGPSAANPAPAAAPKPKKKKKKPSAAGPPSMAMPKVQAMRAQCLLCERNYGNRRDLRRHVLAHHEGVRYMCRLCSKVMMSAKSVRAHLKSSAHRLLNDDEIALNIEKMTPAAAASMVPLVSLNATGAGSSSGSTSTASVVIKKES